MTATTLRRERYYQDRSVGAEGPFRGLLGFCKDTVQGACAGLLSLLGATHILTGSNGVAGPVAGPESFAAVLERFAAGGLAGPVELIGAVVLFLTARRTIARTLGLLLFIGFIAAYMRGYSVPDILTALSALLEGAAGALESIPVRNAD